MKVKSIAEEGSVYFLLQQVKDTFNKGLDVKTEKYLARELLKLAVNSLYK